MGEFSGARTGEPIEQRLARLEGIEAIQRLKERYAHCCDFGYDADGIAIGRWYLLELATMTGVDDPSKRDSVMMSANYEDSFVEIDGEWKFKKVKVFFHHVSNLDEGWARRLYRNQ